MTLAGELWPYVILVLAGFLPNEVWRWLGVAAATGVSDDSELIVWVRCVATAILAGVVAKLVVFAPGALATVPLTGRLGATAIGVVAYFLGGRSMFVGVAAGAVALVLSAFVLVQKPF